jgi:hypothetical protein
MADIYDQHRAAFSNMSAYVVMKDGERVATIAFKFPRDGAGRLYTYVHWLGTEMARGFAGGYGYDKRSAALADVARKLYKRPDYEENTRNHAVISLSNFIFALNKNDGKSWEDNLRDAGFTVLGAV